MTMGVERFITISSDIPFSSITIVRFHSDGLSCVYGCKSRMSGQSEVVFSICNVKDEKDKIKSSNHKTVLCPIIQK